MRFDFTLAFSCLSAKAEEFYGDDSGLVVTTVLQDRR